MSRPERSRQTSYEEMQVNSPPSTYSQQCASSTHWPHPSIGFLQGCETSCKSLSPLQKGLLTSGLRIWKIVIKTLLVNKTLVVPLLNVAMKLFISQCSFIATSWHNLVSFKNIRVSTAQSCESQKAFMRTYMQLWRLQTFPFLFRNNLASPPG